MAKIPCALACGILMYAMVSTRTNIAYAVGVASHYLSNPGKKHWDVVLKSILRYLSGTDNYVMAMEGYPSRNFLIVIMVVVWIIVDLLYLGDQYFVRFHYRGRLCCS